MRALEERYRNDQICIAQFMAQNKETVKKAVSKLKKINLQHLVIDQHDSILTKKIKIRKLKQIVENGCSGDAKQQMMTEVLAYVDLYNIECELIMRRNKKINENSSPSNIDDTLTHYELITHNMLMQDLKFISFNRDYFYGEHEEN